MLYTPAALELARLCPFFSVGGDDDKPEMAESTLVSSAVSADMFATLRYESLEDSRFALDDTDCFDERTIQVREEISKVGAVQEGGAVVVLYKKPCGVSPITPSSPSGWSSDHFLRHYRTALITPRHASWLVNPGMPSEEHQILATNDSERPAGNV